MQCLCALQQLSKLMFFKEYKEPNKFYTGQKSHLEEALTFSTEHANACSNIVKEARSKYVFKSSSSNKQLVRKINKREKIVKLTVISNLLS